MPTVIDQVVSKRFVIETCFKCAIEFGLPERLYEQCQNFGQSFSCPNGHSQVYKEPTVKRLERQLAQAQQQLDQEKMRAREAERNLVTAKSQIIKAKNATARIQKRVGNGVCPCCNRTFCNLQRHMTTKHPEYKNPTGE